MSPVMRDPDGTEYYKIDPKEDEREMADFVDQVVRRKLAREAGQTPPTQTSPAPEVPGPLRLVK